MYHPAVDKSVSLKKKKKYLKKKNSENGRIWIDSDILEVWQVMAAIVRWQV